MNANTTPETGLAGVTVPEGHADLPGHQYAEHGYCAACWEAPEPQTYAEYVSTWYATEYEGDRDTAPYDAETFAYLAATCLQDGGARFTNGVILRSTKTLLRGGGQAGAAVSANGAPVAFAIDAGPHIGLPVSGDHAAQYLHSLPASAARPIVNIWAATAEHGRKPVPCDRTPDEISLALAILDDLQQSATDAHRPLVARQLHIAYAAVERFRTFA